MKIRKEFRVESAHIVRNCTSHRCSHSIHGHSAVIEVFLEHRFLDNAQMVVDFGLMKSTIPVKEFIDSMDHCYLLCSKDDPEFKDFIKKSCDRWIELPFNPSAEMLSVWLLHTCDKIFQHVEFSNGEQSKPGTVPVVTGVRYHETTTGWAEADRTDEKLLWKPEWDEEIKYSEGVMKDWGINLSGLLTLPHYGRIWTEEVPQQIDLK